MRITRGQLRQIIKEEARRLTKETTKEPRIVSMDEFAQTFPQAFAAIKRELESYGDGYVLTDESGGPAFAISQDRSHGYWNAGGDTYVVDQSTHDIGEFEDDEDICTFMESEQE